MIFGILKECFLRMHHVLPSLPAERVNALYMLAGLMIAGLLFVCEALSVIIQVTYFKKTGGKRIFRMAPIHHHFELGGWHETKVVRVFCLFTLVCCIIAIISVM